MNRNIDTFLLYRFLFADEVTEWVEANIPDDCRYTARGYPWRNLLRTFGERAMREVFKHGNFEYNETSYWAEQRLIAWCKKNNRSWTPVSTDH